MYAAARMLRHCISLDVRTVLLVLYAVQSEISTDSSSTHSRGIHTYATLQYYHHYYHYNTGWAKKTGPV